MIENNNKKKNLVLCGQDQPPRCSILFILLLFNIKPHKSHEEDEFYCDIQGAAERTPLFEKQINSKPKKIRQMFFYFWKAHRMPFYIVF